jgi:hypothetical protein
VTGVFHGLVGAAPFILSALFYALSPEVSRLVKDRVSSLISGSQSLVDGKPAGVPSTLSPEYIRDYIEYAIDAAQSFPTFILPIFGFIFAISEGINPIAIIVLLAVGVPILIWIGIKVLLENPISYVGRKHIRGRYSYLSVAGMLINLCAGIVVGILLGLPSGQA